MTMRGVVIALALLNAGCHIKTDEEFAREQDRLDERQCAFAPQGTPAHYDCRTALVAARASQPGVRRCTYFNNQSVCQ